MESNINLINVSKHRRSSRKMMYKLHGFAQDDGDDTVHTYKAKLELKHRESSQTLMQACQKLIIINIRFLLC